MNEIYESFARGIYAVSHLVRTDPPFTLRSGMLSNEYFDKYLFESDPAMLEELAGRMIAQYDGPVDVWAGLEMGGIPLVTIISSLTGIPAVFVRKQRKGHGTDKVIEGVSVRGKRVVVVEDVVTSGGQIVLSVSDLRASAADVDTVLCAIDRQQGGGEKLSEVGLRLLSAFTMADLQKAPEA